ncbi:MAG: hypothetical protein PHW17_12810 [Desulfobacterales bacterium]|nr:hypothetical protein [Desulfobacterales bacterium]MDD3951743.1 hypothetical protein [Desulfobacterales bacterium]MDD4464759.1 hypothetical protein [Desulfobacterales bacterium]
MNSLPLVKEIMTDFMNSTGLSTSGKPPRRYLWTDAFAVCNFLELYRQTGDELWRKTAINLVDQVHYILGCHRQDDARTGWISNLGEEEGARHPTIGGLRIGKEMNERKSTDVYDERMEWNRDGQYYHYLTKWMHALNCMTRSTGDPLFNSWATELAGAAHAGFVHTLKSGMKRMYWKMRIDLSSPLVPLMGQHDPLDGLITYRQIRSTAFELSGRTASVLDSEIADMEALCKGQNWVTADPLGIGGLLGDAYRLMQLNLKDGFAHADLFPALLESSLTGLNAIAKDPLWNLPDDYRLAFRELGMATGLHAVERMKDRMLKNPDSFPGNHSAHALIDRLERHVPLSETIERFWLEPHRGKSRTWTEHRDINSVMLATSLAPGGYLELSIADNRRNAGTTT